MTPRHIVPTQDDLTLERLALERANDDLRISTDECKNVARKLFTVKAKYLETMRELQEVTEQHSDSLGYEKTKNLIAMLDAQTTKSIWYNKHVCGEDPSTSHLSAMLAYANETLQLAPSPDPNAMIRDLLTGSNNDTYRKALAKMSDTLLPTSPCFMAYKEFFAKIICHEDVDGSVIIRVRDHDTPSMMRVTSLRPARTENRSLWLLDRPRSTRRSSTACASRFSPKRQERDANTRLSSRSSRSCASICAWTGRRSPRCTTRCSRCASSSIARRHSGMMRRWQRAASPTSKFTTRGLGMYRGDFSVEKKFTL